MRARVLCIPAFFKETEYVEDAKTAIDDLQAFSNFINYPFLKEFDQIYVKINWGNIDILNEEVPLKKQIHSLINNSRETAVFEKKFYDKYKKEEEEIYNKYRYHLCVKYVLMDLEEEDQ